jgi:excisionase family DNA binding protein
MNDAVQIRRRLLRMKKAAEYMDMHPWSLRQLVQRGELSYISAGDNTSAWRFDIADLDGWIEAHRIGSK